ncbi:hypothetical protein, partial [Helicobacter sp. MIT 11-5569]|uniref:hypothetical protein n=1 Tax=Helicobacter sp. MIT 11-5569 TaxID=1548151 RepID=UPI00137551B4
ISNSNLYANYSNSYLSLYNNSRTNDKTELDSTITTQESQTTQLSDEEARQMLDELLKNPESSPLGWDSSLFVNNDSATLKYQEFNEERRKQALNKEVPSDSEFQSSVEYLLGQMEDILVKGLKENPNDLELQNLLAIYRIGSAKLDFKNDSLPYKSYLDRKRDAQEALSELKSGTLPKDFNKTMSSYMSGAFVFEGNISDFLYHANQFGMIPQNQEDKIMNAWDKTQAYLLNQSGDLGNNSFQLGDAIISWDGNSPFRDYFDGTAIKVEFLKSDDIFASLSSNFDSSQSFFDILEKRDKLEKENQELKTKQAYSAYGISNTTNSIKTDSTSNSIIQTLLKDSKENNKNLQE